MDKSAVNYLDTFIQGQVVDLCIPTVTFASESNWYAWFNDAKITKYLGQVAKLNTRKLQRKFFESVGSDRFILIMIDKKRVPIGVISLSSINFDKKSCDIALVVSNDGDRKDRPFQSFEAMALMTIHAFENLRMKRVNAGQHIKLKGWQNRLELIGYKLEGLHINEFVKGNHTANSVSISVSAEDYEQLKLHRNGMLWDGLSLMKERFKNLPKRSFCDELMKFYDEVRSDYYKKVFEL